MSAVRLLLPRGNLQRWHIALRDRLVHAGLRIGLRAAPGAEPPLALRLCVDLERLVYRRREASLCDPIDDVRLDDLDADDALLVDLTGAPDPAMNVIAPLYDGAPGDAARDAALLDGRMPRLALARVYENDFEILAEGLPAHERPWSLNAGREAVAARLLALAPFALRNRERGDFRAPKSAVARRNPVSFMAASLASRAKTRLSRLVAHDHHWRIGWRPLLADGGAMARQNWSGDGWTWLADDRARYYADPFPFTHEGRTFLFCEEFPYATGKGVISVAALDPQGRAETPRIVLEADCHLSYPLVFRRDGEIWMMPESSGGNRLDLYRAERFPDRWVPDRTLIGGVDISDATPFEAHGRWWMTATTGEGGSSWDCLSLFSAPDPLGPWTRCGDGPVLVDASCARPAGLVRTIGGALWRPAQDCVGGYGKGLALCRIDHVCEDGLDQTVVTRLGPPPGAPSHGVHTLNIGGGFEFIDAVGPARKRGARDEAGP